MPHRTVLARWCRAIAAPVFVFCVGSAAGCEFDSTLPEVRHIDVPVVICDAQASACSMEERQELAWILDLGDAEFIDTSIGAVPESGQPLIGSAGCEFHGTLSMPAFFSSGRLLALDEDAWVTDCRPGADLFSFEDGMLTILGTAVFRRGQEGCEVRTANFCN